MTNSKKIEAALAPYAGHTLSTKQIKAVVLEAFPEVAIGSILPSDIAGVNSKGKQYGDQLLAREGSGYRVLAADEIVRKPKSSGRSKETLDEALASAKAMLATAAE